MSDRIWHIRKIVPDGAPTEFRQHLLKLTQREVGNQIFDMLWTNKLPAVVDLEENIYHNPEAFYRDDEDIIEYKITVKNVRYRDVEIARMPEFDLGYYREPNLQERITRWIKKKVSRLSNWRSRLSF